MDEPKLKNDVTSELTDHGNVVSDEISKHPDVLTREYETKFVNLVKSDQYPVELRAGISNVLDIIKQEKSITDLYPEVLAEVPISQSHFQDICVQYLQHYTPHKKLRQAVMEMQDRLNALYTAKTGQKRAFIKVERLKSKLNKLSVKIEKNDDETFDMMELSVDLEEAERELHTATHMIKDAMLKVVHQQKLVNKFTKEVEETNMSYEQAEAVYYVMYFTSEAERQLRTGDHQIDRGTFGAISQMPDKLRHKILNNISFLRQKIFDKDFNHDSDYLTITHEDVLKPTVQDGCVEGLKISEFLDFEPIKLISK